ncbi:MAG: M36 family metallopeptidase, partial [Solirubrobacteraceae bacterium]
MFLWTGKTETTLVTPTTTPSSSAFVNGPHTFELTGEAVLATNTADGTHSACSPVNADVAGKIAVFEFTGACGSVTAVDNVKAAGAIGVIGITTSTGPGAPPILLGGSAAANIPGVVLGNDEGLALEASLPATLTITSATTLEKDGDFDNAIIAHEWGHYLHHRLASCEQTLQCAGMSEGWGDFNALMMMLRETDNRDGTFGAALFALTAGGLESSGFTDPGYFGIRRFPYSLNRAKNGLSLRHIGDENPLPDTATNPGPAGNPNSEVHNAGEIWAQMMWEAYNVVIDNRGFVEAHRRMTDYVVAGLLLTPPEATFTEARDAILAAAGALDTDDMILMAAAFAGRGAGTCAVSPARDSVDNAGVVESGTIAARLETSPATVSDDGVSCDHDGILDPGESGTLHITVANSGVIAAEGVSVTATTTTPGVTLGKRIEVGNVAALSHVDIAIPVKLAANAPVNSTLDITVNVQGDAGCSTGRLAIALHAPMG